jgi:hypothetical protein
MRQNVEWDKTSNDKKSNGTKCRTIIRFYVINLEKMLNGKMSENIWICPCPRSCVPVGVHLPMSTSTCPCVPVRVRVPLGHGHGQGHMDVDMGTFLPLNFHEFIIHVYIMSNRFFFLQKIISF